MFKNKLDNYEEILQKYKEITGVSDEKKWIWTKISKQNGRSCIVW
jgi:hypothetical protein